MRALPRKAITPTAIACLALALFVALALGPVRAEAAKIKNTAKRGTKAELVERGARSPASG